LQNCCHPRMPLSGIQLFQSLRIWIPDQKRFGNDNFGLLQEPQITVFNKNLNVLTLTSFAPFAPSR
jgi:hypothetical protein